MFSSTAFNAYSIKQKTDALLQQGQFLYTRQEPAYVVDSYKLDHFYVEIYYNKNEETLPVFRAFSEGETAAPFFPEDKIHYLYQQVVCGHTA